MDVPALRNHEGMRSERYSVPLGL